MKLLLKGILLMAIFGVHLCIPLSKSSKVVHPTIPPLTHTPGMGVSLIGYSPAPPQHLLDSIIANATVQEQQQVSELRNTHKVLVQKGYDLRLDMQSLFKELLTELPKDLTQTLLLSRWEEEQRVGEMATWDQALDIQSR